MDELEKVFLGRISAGMTHEINNVLATIREATGLMKDLLLQGKDLSTPLQEKLVSVSERVARQVERGSYLTTRLNRFAHSLDHPERVEDPDELLGLTVDINQRFARLKKVQLNALPCSRNQRLSLPSFHIQLLLANALSWLMDRTAGGGEIILRPTVESGRLTIEMEARPVSESPTEMADTFTELATHVATVQTFIGADFKNRTGVEGFSIILDLPPAV